MILIDGGQGEGGGQILRTALALSLLTRKSFRIENIRAGRKKPGLLRQHLTAVEAATRISKAEVNGAEIGSRMLTFAPGEIVPGEYHFAVGTAGSATLVLQTILLPLATASASSHLTLEGGTHNPYAPPFDFLQKAFLPIINRMGPEIVAKLERPGFYPAGGGKFVVTIKPATKLSPMSLLEKGKSLSKTARVLICNLPLHIAERELQVIAAKMSLLPEQLQAEEITKGPGPGNVVMLEFVYENVVVVFTGFGEANIRAEAVAATVVKEAQEYLAAEVPVGTHLADQLLLPFACAGEGAFVTQPLTRHAETNIAIIRKFLDVEVSVEKLAGKQRLVKISRIL
ncbi:RNA 3'-terminal phosphate cyclase [candidate division KSB1 bacterium]|nr:RNA 3'-terminal phosphate cyclase [candidate division KSB1 bacterium]